MDNVQRIQDRIDMLSSLMRRINGLPSGAVARETAQNIAEECKKWKEVTASIVMEICGQSDPHLLDFGMHWRVPLRGQNFKAEMMQKLKRAKTDLEIIVEIEKERSSYHDTMPTESVLVKSPKVFISHKKEDKAFADALVSLINFILGADGDKIFCSSVQGYGIKQSRDIMDELKMQFENYDIFMVIIHSPRYYQSAICLNEMGAAWVLGTRFSSFLTKDCKPDQMRGVINKEKIYIDPNDAPDQLNAHLNDFKNDLVAFFGIQQVDENKWENARSRFIKEVSSLTYKSVGDNDVDLFERLYLPAFDHIFEMLDVDHFQEWTYSCAIGGNTILSASIYERLDQLSNYIKSRPKHSQYSSWDALMRNLGLLISDFQMVFSQHEERLDEKRYWVERFYKRNPNNPHYERDLEAYNQYVCLVADLLFELTRICNLILGRIRQQYPVYKQELGLLHIDNNYSSPDLIYKEGEISDTPYPGLDEFIRVRLSRETHYGTNPNINASGYEKR